MTDDLPFFIREGDRYLPTEATRGYWTPESINGRVVVGLLGFELERLHGDAGFQPARLTVDMYRLPDRSPVEVVTRVIRAGGRLKLVEADFVSNGRPMGRASCQFLRRTADPPGRYWRAPGWSAPPPESVPSAPSPNGRHWDVRQVAGEIGSPGPRQAWIRDTRELVGGFPLTPFTRVAVAADYASPFANSGSEGVGYINSDVTAYLHRLPRTEWIGFEVRNHQAADGVAIGECWLYDEDGPIGTATAAAIAQQRREALPEANDPPSRT